MDFQKILSVLKGDVVGHEFHGNQHVKVDGAGNVKPRRGNRWIDSKGGFNPNGGIGKPVEPKVRAEIERAQSDINARISQSQSTSSTDPVSAKPLGGEKFVALKTPEIAKVIDPNLNFNVGEMNNGFKLVEMKDGSTGVVKGMKDGYNAGWDVSAEYQAQSEILCGKIAQAINAPVRVSEPVEGSATEVVQPYLNGETLTYKQPTSEMEAQLDDLRFFDQLVGNGDRFSPYGAINNGGNIMLTDDNRIVGIDNALTLLPKSVNLDIWRQQDTPDFNLLGAPTKSDLDTMFQSLKKTEPDFIAMGRQDSYATMIDRFTTGAVNYLVNHPNLN